MNDSCKLCDLLGVEMFNPQEFTEESTKMDHARIHLCHVKLVKKMKIAQIFDQCFPKISGGQQDGDENGNSRSRILALSKRVFSTLSSPVTCQECEMEMNFYNQSTKYWRWNQIIDHACKHLGLAVYKCKHCDYEASLKDTMLRHGSNVHQLKAKKGEKFDDFSSSFEDEIKEWIRRCFEKGAPKSSMNNVQINRSRILALCKAIFSKLSNPVTCQECQLSMALFNQPTKCWQWNQIIDHACRHLGKAMYECRRCDYETSSKKAILVHISTAHQLKAKKGKNFDDFSPNYEEEIKESIRSCFEKGAPKLPTNKIRIKSRIERKIWDRLGAQGNELKLDRHLLAQRLLTEFSNENGKIQCGVCSRMLTPHQIGQAIDHAEMHLKKKMYKCKKCPAVSSSWPTIRYHVSKKHKVTCSGNYEDRTDQFHKEIKDMVRKCFGGKKD